MSQAGGNGEISFLGEKRSGQKEKLMLKMCRIKIVELSEANLIVFIVW